MENKGVKEEKWWGKKYKGKERTEDRREEGE